MNIETTLLTLDYFYSLEMDKVREKMVEGKYISGCEVCYEQGLKQVGLIDKII